MEPPNMDPQAQKIDRLLGSSLCESCSRWNFERTFTEPFWLVRDDDHLIGKPASQPLNLEEIKQNTSCQFCRLIVNTLAEQAGYIDFDKATKVNVSLYPHDFGKYRRVDEEYLPTFGHNISRLSISAYEAGDDKRPEPGAVVNGYGCGIQLLAQQGPAQTQNPDPFLKGRKISDQVDTRLIEYWLRRCSKDHDFCIPESVDIPSLRFINIKERKIVDAVFPCQFATLSYTWGPPTTAQLTLARESWNRLTIIGGLDDSWDDIPHTIRDAITLCGNLGIPYLWVDALCIQQDDPEDLKHINVMGAVYSAAHVTIVSAAGIDSWAGLPGILKGSRRTKVHMEMIHGLLLGNTQRPYGEAMRDAVWNTRAWTFQESILSKRLLIFTADQVFYVCNQALWWEDTHLETSPAEHIDVQLRYDKGTSDEFVKSTISEERIAKDSYLKLVNRYVLRRITYRRDTLRAFTGILNALKRPLGTEFFHGLPESFFDIALAWYAIDPLTGDRSSDFPSWSWACLDMQAASSGLLIGGKKLRVCYPAPDFSLKCLRSEVTWYRFDSHEGPSMNLRQIPNTDVEQSLRFTSAAARIQPNQLPHDLTDIEKSHLLIFESDSALLNVSTAPIMDSSKAKSVAFGISLPPLSYPYVPPTDYLFSDLYPERPVDSVVLNKVWRATQPDKLEFIVIASDTSGLDDGRPEDSVLLMLIETDERGLSRRVTDDVHVERSIWEAVEVRKRRWVLLV